MGSTTITGFGGGGGGNGKTSTSTLDLTIQVFELSQNVTRMDLITFFSYCGTVAHSELIQRKEDETQFALVTFMQPYALETALLLNDAIIVDSRIRILPLGTSHDPNSVDDHVMMSHKPKISLFGQKERKILWRSIKIQD